MNLSRRTFLKNSSIAAGIITASNLTGNLPAAEPFVRAGRPRLHLALAAYSFRKQFRWMRGNPQTPEDTSKPMDMFKFIDYCADHDCLGTELTSYFFPVDADLVYYNRLKHYAFVRGITISGTAIGNDFSLPKGIKLDYQIEAAKQGIDQAAMMGAPHVRFFAGTGNGFSESRDRVNNAIEALQECCDYAGERGIFVGVENHGNITPELLLEIIHKVDSPWLGINLDTGNFWSKDPYADLERCVKYAVNVQVKVSMQSPDRKKYPADLKRVVDILKKGNYQGFVVLEYEEDKPFEEIPGYLSQLNKLLHS